jgi:hypothetical protein
VDYLVDDMQEMWKCIRGYESSLADCQSRLARTQTEGVGVSLLNEYADARGLLARVLKSFTLMAKNEPHEDMINICAEIQRELGKSCEFCSHPHDHYHGCRMEDK